jgi:hypothetical protein
MVLVHAYMQPANLQLYATHVVQHGYGSLHCASQHAQTQKKKKKNHDTACFLVILGPGWYS